MARRPARRPASRGPGSDARLLGGLSADSFLARHWQRKPLLIRDALDVSSQPTTADVFELAARDDVEARVVERRGSRWSLQHGPFDRLPRAKRDWTLLVQGVNLFDPAADALLRRFDFVPAMRVDDLMISYAVDGGGVGPHLDSYDVFLVQLAGRRRWRWRTRPSIASRERALVEGAPIKLLEHFDATDEAILEPGDMLYLPPSCAHEGVALGPCLTASVGFRLPTWDELTRQFLVAMGERAWSTGRHADAGRPATSTPGALDAAFLAAFAERLERVRFAPRDIEDFVGTHFSEPKPTVYFEAPGSATLRSFVARAKRHGLALDLRTTMLYRRRRAYLVGEAFDLPAATLRGFRRLADRRRLDARETAAIVADSASCTLLHEWWQHGWIRFDDGAADGAP